MEVVLFKNKELSRADINFYGQELKDLIDKREIDVFTLSQNFSAIKKLEEEVKESLRAAIVQDASKYPEKSFELHGCTFTKTESGVTYDYSKCNDPVLVELQQAFDKAKEAVTNRQKFLQGINGHETIIDKNTGEILTVYPPSKKSTTTVSCKIL